MKSALNRLTKQIVVLLIIGVFILSHPLTYFLIPQASAGVLSSAKLMINNSQAAATGVTYQFRFTTSVTTSIKQITILICTTGSGTCTTPSGITTTTAVRATDNLAGSSKTDTLGANGTLTLVAGTPATQSTQAMYIDYTTITNPSTINTTYYARITTYSDTGTTVIDSSTVAFAVLDTNSIAVTAIVDPSLTFSIAGVTGNGSATVNSATITNGMTTTAKLIYFGNINPGTARIAAQDLTISTNAGSGYTITASHAAQALAGPLVSSNSAHKIDAFTGTNSSPTTWSSPNSTTPDTNTGFFGYTTEDASLCTGTAARFTSSGGNKWAGSTTVGQEVVCSSTPVSSETTRVGYEVEVDAYQPPSTYTGTVILIATPTY